MTESEIKNYKKKLKDKDYIDSCINDMSSYYAGAIFDEYKNKLKNDLKFIQHQSNRYKFCKRVDGRQKVIFSHTDLQTVIDFRDCYLAKEKL